MLQSLMMESTCAPTSAHRTTTIPRFHACSGSIPSFCELRTLIQRPMRTPRATRKPYVGRKKRPKCTSCGYTVILMRKTTESLPDQSSRNSKLQGPLALDLSGLLRMLKTQPISIGIDHGQLFHPIVAYHRLFYGDTFRP